MKKIFLLSLLLMGAVSVWAESDKSLEDMMGDMAEEIGKAYVSPTVKGFCTNMNSGWFNKAPEDEVLGLDIELSIVAMGTTFEEKDKTFDMTTSSKISLSKDLFEDLATTIIDAELGVNTSNKTDLVEDLTEALWEEFGGTEAGLKIRAYGPTVIGSKDERVNFYLETDKTVIETDDGKKYYLDTDEKKTITTDVSGFDLPIIPLAAFQFSLGTLYGTKATFRFLPPMKLDEEIGTLSYYGGALQHNPKMFLPVLDILPFDLDISGSYQSFELGDIISTTAWTAGMNISRKFGWEFLNLTPYTGIMLESSKMKFSYDYELTVDEGKTQTSSIEFEEKGPNSFRVPVGLGVRLGLVNLSAEYFFAEQSGFSANLALAF